MADEYVVMQQERVADPRAAQSRSELWGLGEPAIAILVTREPAEKSVLRN